MPRHDWTRVSAGSFHTFHTAWITEIGMALPGMVLFLDPQWYVTVPLEGT